MLCLDSCGIITSSLNETRILSRFDCKLGFVVFICILSVFFIVQSSKSVVFFPLLYNTGTTTSLFLPTYQLLKPHFVLKTALRFN